MRVLSIFFHKIHVNLKVNIFGQRYWSALVNVYGEALPEEQYLDANCNLPISVCTGQVSTIKSTKFPIWKQTQKLFPIFWKLVFSPSGMRLSLKRTPS